MKFFIATANDKPWSETARNQMIDVAARCQNPTHQRTDNAEQADIILFIDNMQLVNDWKMSFLRNHPLVLKYPQKVFVYDECDIPRDFLPGVYVSMPKQKFDKSRHGAFSYRILVNEFSAAESVSVDTPTLLFSFQGRRGDEVRSAILDLKSARSLIEDTSHLNFFGSANPESIAKGKEKYRSTILNSKFVLCPQGAGTSSLRLFETLGAGRVPVVISDNFVFPRDNEIDWKGCSIQVSEREIGNIPQILEEHEGNYASLSKQARAVYESWFAPDVWFHHVIEQCLELQKLGTVGPKKNYFFNAEVLLKGTKQEVRALKAKISGRKTT